MNKDDYFERLDEMLGKTLVWCRKIYSAEIEEKKKLLAVLTKQGKADPDLILHFWQLVIKLDQENERLQRALQQRSEDKDVRVFQTFRSFVNKMFGQNKGKEPNKQ